MLATRKRAAAPTAARKNNSYAELYPAQSRSSTQLKEQFGELLLFLQTPLNQIQKRSLWQLFEVKLGEYLDLRFCEAVR